MLDIYYFQKTVYNQLLKFILEGMRQHFIDNKKSPFVTQQFIGGPEFSVPIYHFLKTIGAEPTIRRNDKFYSIVVTVNATVINNFYNLAVCNLTRIYNNDIQLP